MIESDTISVTENAVIRGGYTLLHAEDTLQLWEGSTIESLRENTCNMETRSKELFDCVARYSDQTQLTTEYFTERFQKLYPREQTLATFTSVMTGLMYNYTNYLVANNEVRLINSRVEGPRIGICSTNLVLKDSILQASGHGCLGDEGLGRGHQVGECAGSGGSHGGRGGYGGVENDDDQNYIEKCQNHYPEPYHFYEEADFEGSGGASGSNEFSTGGNGGGLIKLSALQDLSLHRSEILANGFEGE